MVISLVRVLLGLLSLTRVANGTFTFRTAMVMDASNDVSLGRLRGHAAFLSVLATKYPQGVPLGREIEGVDRPRFNFSIEVMRRALLCYFVCLPQPDGSRSSTRGPVGFSVEVLCREVSKDIFSRA